MTDRKRAIFNELCFRAAFKPGPSEAEQLKAFAFFCKQFVKLQVAEKELPFVLRNSQRETARHLIAGENVIVLKARQIGFSTLFANYALWKVLCNPSYSVLFLSSKQDEAIYLLAKAKFAYSRFPAWLKNRLPSLTTNNKQEILFANHASITSLPSRQDAARGRTTSLLIADEFASLNDQEEAWAAMLPATDVGGQAVVLSTAKGAGDLFESLWNRSRAGAMRFTPLFWSWREAFDDAWYANKQKELLPWQLAQEHPTDAEEAFIRSGNAVFDLDVLKRQRPLSPLVGDIHFSTPNSASFREAKNGPMRVWETPEEGVKYVVGVDIAEGLEHGDRSVAVILRGDTSELAAIYTTNSFRPWEFARIVAELGWWYNGALIGPERNNHGHAFIRGLVELEYFPIYRNFRKQTRREKQTEELGWLTTPKSKAYLINQLDKFVTLEPEDGGDVHNIPDEITVNEMKVYKRDEHGKMGGSPFDDHVMAYAIAVEMTNYVHDAVYRSKAPQATPGTLAWYEKTSMGGDKQGHRLGEHEQKSLVS